MSLLVRCSEIGRIMANAKNGEALSVGAKTYVRERVKESIFGFSSEVSSKQMEKGTEVEDDSILLYSTVTFQNCKKNTERRKNQWITGECDLLINGGKKIADIKSSWSVATFPVFACDADDYMWQLRGYMMLWEAEEAETAHCLVDTPDHLLSPWDDHRAHKVNHFPPKNRVTIANQVKRDLDIEALICQKVEAVQAYYTSLMTELMAAGRIPYQSEEAAA